jgi:hypothetical protein
MESGWSMNVFYIGSLFLLLFSASILIFDLILPTPSLRFLLGGGLLCCVTGGLWL